MNLTKVILGISIICLILAGLAACGTTVGTANMSKEDKYTQKWLLKISNWKSKQLKVNGREINVKGVMGDVYMDFYVYESKDSDGKKEQVLKHKIDMAGSNRIFDFSVKNDSVKFVGVEGWNDYEIKRIDKEELVLLQIADSKEYRWVMVPAEKKK